MFHPKEFSRDQALKKARHYCSYQERSHQELKEKLYSFGLRKNEVEEIIATLTQEDYLNEQRFAEAFAGGKFQMKNWGKGKIRFELQKKKLSPYCIKKGMAQIDPVEYDRVFLKLASRKWASLKREKNIFIRKSKTRAFLLQKGYEFKLITDFLNKNEG
jgi:regulatory protein